MESFCFGPKLLLDCGEILKAHRSCNKLLRSISDGKIEGISVPTFSMVELMGEVDNVASGWITCAEVARQKNDFSVAYKRYSKAVDLMPGHVVPYFRRADFLYFTGRLENSLSDLVFRHLLFLKFFQFSIIYFDLSFE